MTKRQAQNLAKAMRGPNRDYKLIPPPKGRYQTPGGPETGWRVAMPYGGNDRPSGTMIFSQNSVSYKYDLLWHQATGDERMDDYFFMPEDDREDIPELDEGN